MMVANYCIYWGIRMMDNAFSILANLWRYLLGTMEQHTDTVFLLVEMAVLLHNFPVIHCPCIGNVEVD